MPFQLLTLVGLISFALPCLGQSNRQFQWNFTDPVIFDAIPACAVLQIVVQDSHTKSTHGVPPYYMFSFELDGTLQRTFLGTDDNNLNWQVTHTPGSRLALSVVDSTGGAGGMPPRVLTVVEGQSTQCVVSSTTAQSFTVKGNVTTNLTTCQPWGLTVKGGVPPYNVTLMEFSSSSTTNISVPDGFDQFTYINRANPDSLLVAAVSDFNGSWAYGTPFVNTNGTLPTENSCRGLVSSSGNASMIQQQSGQRNHNLHAPKPKRSTIVGVVVTLLLLLVIGIAGLAFWRRRRRQKAELAEAKATQFVDPPPEVKMLSINNYLVQEQKRSPNQSRGQTNRNRGQPTPASRKALILAELRNIEPSGNSSQRERSSSMQDTHDFTMGLLASVSGVLDPVGSTGGPTGSRSGNVRSNSGFARFPASSNRQSLNMLESNVLAGRSPESDFHDSALRRGIEVFQHRDGGVARISLPPPYADTTL